MKFLEFHSIIIKNQENLIIPQQNHENYEIHKVPRQNNKITKKQLFMPELRKSRNS